jgi:hypothetical protein
MEYHITADQLRELVKANAPKIFEMTYARREAMAAQESKPKEDFESWMAEEDSRVSGK